MPVLDSDGGGALFGGTQKIVPAEAKRGGKVFVPSTTHDPNWRPPKSFRSIRGLPIIGLDIEGLGLNPRIKEQNGRRTRIVGIAIAYGGGDDDAVYYPLDHERGNMENPKKVIAQLREEAREFTGVVCGANLLFDLDWLRNRHGIVFPKAEFHDVQIAEPLIDENKLTYALDTLAKQYCGLSKGSDKLEEVYGSGYIENMDLVHPCYADFYARWDVILPIRIRDQQLKTIEREDLGEVFSIERRLLPLLLEMKSVGVRVDLDATNAAYRGTQEERDRQVENIVKLSGVRPEIWAADSLAQVFDAMGLSYNKTSSGKPSFTKDFLLGCNQEVAQSVIDARAFDKIGGTFLKSYILEGHIDGRLHASFNQLRSDDAGAVSGRFSSSGPNLQNIPARHPVLGPLCRAAFIPEEGMLWGSLDWSQIEYRFLVHYASITKGVDAGEAVRMYRSNPNTDFHQMAADLTGLPRKQVKSINFGVVYGMGVAKLAIQLKVSFDEAAAIMETFHGNSPFIKQMLERCSRAAEHRGFIKTILGRRRRFETYEAGDKIFHGLAEAEKAYEEMSKNNRRIREPRRAFTYSALNSLLQGSAADLMKKAMVEMWEAGLFNQGLLVPHLTVHDEFNSSVPDTKEGHQAFEEQRRIMQETMTLEVPVLADGTMGTNWKEAKDD